MKIDPGPVHQYLTQFEFSNWVRIFPFRHKSTPLQAVPTPSRFVPGTTFAGLYGATDLATGIAEAIVRDDFEMAPGSMRFITNGKLEKYCVLRLEQNLQSTCWISESPTISGWVSIQMPLEQRLTRKGKHSRRASMSTSQTWKEFSTPPASHLPIASLFMIE